MDIGELWWRVDGWIVFSLVFFPLVMVKGGCIYRLGRGPLHFLCMWACVGVCWHVSSLHLHTHASSFQPQNTHIFCHVFPFTFTHTWPPSFQPQINPFYAHVCVFPLPMCVCFSFAFAHTCSSLFQPTIHPFSAHAKPSMPCLSCCVCAVHVGCVYALQPVQFACV